MAVVKNLMVRAGADFSPITKQAQKAQGSIRTMGQKVGQSCNAMKTAFNGLKKVLGALGVALSVGAIVNAAKDAKAAYDAQAEAEAKLTQVMRNTMGARAADIASIKALTSAQQELGIIGDEVQLAGAQEMATYLGEKASLEKLIPVMNDMIAQQYGYNATQESAVNIATMMGKVMNGQVGALSRYGYTFTEAQAAILKYGTEAERAATLADVIEQSVGGMNQALASTPTGRMQQLKNTLGDIKEQFGQAVTTIGTVFLPLLKQLAGVLADVATIANKIAQAIANVFGSGSSAQAAIIGYGSTASDAVGEIGEAAEDAAASAEKLGTAGFDTLQKLSSGGSSSSGSSANEESGSGGVSAIYEDAEDAAESVGWLEAGLRRLKEIVSDWDTSKLSQSLQTLKEQAEPLVDLFGNALGWVFENVLVPLGQWTIEDYLPAQLDNLAAALGLLKAGADKLKPVWVWLWDHVISPVASAIGTVLVDSLTALTIVLNDLTDWINGTREFDELTLVVGIKAIWKDTKEKISKKWKDITSGVKDKAAKIRAKWANTVDGVRQRWAKLTAPIKNKVAEFRGKWANSVEGIRQTWAKLTAPIKDKVAELRGKWANSVEGIRQTWANLTAPIKDKTANIRAEVASKWEDLRSKWQSLTQNFKDITVNVKAEISAKISDLKQWINTSIIDPINQRLQNVNIAGWHPFANVQIPRLALGGYLRANNPTLAVVGDNPTQGEIVSPEGKLAAMANEAARAAVQGARYAMSAASGIRTPPDIPSVLRALTGPYGAAALSVGGVGDEAMTLLRRLLSAVEDGKILTVDRQAFGRLIRQANTSQTKAVGAVNVVR